MIEKEMNTNLGRRICIAALMLISIQLIPVDIQFGTGSATHNLLPVAARLLVFGTLLFVTELAAKTDISDTNSRSLYGSSYVIYIAVTVITLLSYTAENDPARIRELSFSRFTFEPLLIVFTTITAGSTIIILSGVLYYLNKDNDEYVFRGVDLINSEILCMLACSLCGLSAAAVISGIYDFDFFAAAFILLFATAIMAGFTLAIHVTSKAAPRQGAKYYPDAPKGAGSNVGLFVILGLTAAGLAIYKALGQGALGNISIVVGVITGWFTWYCCISATKHTVSQIIYSRSPSPWD